MKGEKGMSDNWDQEELKSYGKGKLVSIVNEQDETIEVLKSELTTLSTTLQEREDDARRWSYFADSPQTALMLGSKLDPTDTSVNWVQECNRLADKALTGREG